MQVQVKEWGNSQGIRLSESELLEKLERSREHASQGLFRDADEVVHNMRTKYGL